MIKFDVLKYAFPLKIPIHYFIYNNNNNFIKNFFNNKNIFNNNKNNKNYFSIYKFLKPYYQNSLSKKYFYTSMFLTFISKGLNTFPPIFFQKGINFLSNNNNNKIQINNINNNNNLIQAYSYFTLSFMTKFISKFILEIRDKNLTFLSNNISHNFLLDSLDYLNLIPYSEYKNNTELIYQKIIKINYQLEKFNKFLIGNFFSNFSEIFFISIYMYKYLGKEICFNTIKGYSLYILYSKYISDYRKKLFKKLNDIDNDFNIKLIDIINNINIVKYFQGENKERNNFNKLINFKRKINNKLQETLTVLNLGQNFIINFTLLCNIFNLIKKKEFINYSLLYLLKEKFNQLNAPLNIMGYLLRELEESKNILNDGIYIQNYIKENQNENKKNKLNFKEGLIKFENVSFKYNNNNNNNNENILKNLNVQFEPNKLNIIFGSSGQGKSTLFDLLYKLYLPNKGKIYIDNQDINNIDIKSLRDYLSIVPQNGNLFNESFLYNLNYNNNNNNNNNKEVLNKFISLFNLNQLITSKNINNNVGSFGNKLSGGEKQRILIIRALLKKYKILLLDEPTSNLDSYNEKIIMDYIRKNVKGKTIILTCHKYNNIKEGDNIFLLKNGEIKKINNFNNINNIISELKNNMNKLI